VPEVPPPGAAVPAEDALALHEVLARYGHLIDERIFDRFDEVFTADVVYDASDFGDPVLHGVDAVAEQMRTTDAHPLAHHATNILLDPRPDGSITVLSKGLGIGPKGRVGSVVYVDRAVRTDAGWRLASRTALLRRPEQGEALATGHRGNRST